jgi:general secretion pathway protein J
MRPSTSDKEAGHAGFTLIETLAALALMGLILSLLATLTSQWLPNWDRGFDRIQRNESVSIALDRISADIGASEFMRPNSQTKNVLFDGTEQSLTFARTSLGPNASPGLDVIRISETAGSDGFTVTRSRSSFVPGAMSDYHFSDPVVLLRAPYRMSFSYAGGDKVWKGTWRESDKLPAAVMLTVRDASTQRTLALSRIAVIRINASVESICTSGDCGKDGTPQGAELPQASAGQPER